MYRDSEQAYRGWTLDVYQDSMGRWCCDYWYSGTNLEGFMVGARRKEVIASVQKVIDDTEEAKKEATS